MKVIYDISMLGGSPQKNEARGGIFRMVRNVAIKLTEVPDCDVVFSATNNTGESLNYLRQNASLAAAKVSVTRMKKWVGGNKVVFKKQFHFDRGKELPLRNLRKPLGSLYRAFESLFDPIENRVLGGAQIFHSTFYSIPRQVRRMKGIKQFLTVYDLNPLLYPTISAMSSKEFIKILKSANDDGYFFCVSESTRKDLCETLQVDPARVFVTYGAASRELFYPSAEPDKLNFLRKKYRLPNALYLLSLGLFEPRRNIFQSLRCFARLVEQGELQGVHFVLAGVNGWGSEKLFRYVEQHDVLKARVSFTGYVDEEDLAVLYSGALAFVYPSFYEGFGLPLLEAMQCGTPVIASNTSSMPEVVGEGGVLVSPNDTDALCRAILKIVQEPVLRDALSKNAIQQAAKFRWEKTTEEIIAAYKWAISN